MAGGSVAARVANVLIEFAIQRGVRRDQLLSAADLAGGHLEQPDGRIPLDAYVRLMRSASHLCADPAFALHFGETIDIREMSIAALLGQSLGTAMDVLGAVNRYVSLDIDVQTEGDVRLELVPRGGKLWLVDRRTVPNAFPELTESAFARMVAAARRIGLEMPIRELHVTHPAPTYRSEYERIFGVPIRFDSEWNALAIEVGAMAQVIALQPAYAGDIIAARADILLKQMHDARTTAGVVQEALNSLLREGKAQAAALAMELGLSRSTLYRRLKAEGTSFEDILQTTRLKLARELLLGGQMSIEDIGLRLGFAGGPSFSKAFKRWTGSSPGVAREQWSSSRTEEATGALGGVEFNRAKIQPDRAVGIWPGTNAK